MLQRLSIEWMKLKNYRVHKNPMGVDGDVVEGRYIYDSFVLDNKINGIYVHAQNGMASCPSGDNGVSASGLVTLSCATSGAAIKYTTDGSNPKTSSSALIFSAAFTAPASGSLVRAYASKAGLVASPVFKLAIA